MPDVMIRSPWLIDQLPRDPQALRHVIPNGRCEQLDVHCVQAVAELFRAYVIPNDLAGAMWAMLADSDVLHYLGETTDRLGRPALGFAVDAYPDDDRADNFFLLLVSPDNGQLIGWEEVAVNQQAYDFSVPTVIGFTIWKDARFVESVGDGGYR